MEKVNSNVVHEPSKHQIKLYSNFFVLTMSLLLLFFSPLLFILFFCFTSPFVDSRLRVLFSPLIPLCAVTFYASLKPFSDLAEYMNVYHQVNDGTIDIFNYERFGHGAEILILMIMKVSGWLFSNNDQMFLISIYFCIFAVIYATCIRVNRRYHLALFGLLFFTLGFIESMSYFVRQNLSLVIFIYAVYAVRNSKFRFLLFILSFTAHISGIINIAVYYFAVIYKKKISGIQGVFKLLIAVLFIGLALLAFVKFTPLGESLLLKSNAVVNNTNFSLMPLTYVALAAINTLVIVYLISKSKGIDTVTYYLFLKEILFFFLLLPLPAVSNRLGMILFSYCAVFMFYFFKNPANNAIAYKRVAVLLAVNLLPFMYSMSIISANGNDYTFYNNQPLTYNLFQVIDELADRAQHGVIYLDNGNN
ncbi:EpsG family protein [Winslowiella toletana]|uniref:EpsG family protein n=1 Tax=Winslowiella toletana TaxID=92490 RepID=UPI0028BF11C0|nr:EpsG family protein [Winslowiella toletana]WNN42966.1 EpsG family protein [Winslowiella toletana]